MTRAVDIRKRFSGRLSARARLGERSSPSSFNPGAFLWPGAHQSLKINESRTLQLNARGYNTPTRERIENSGAAGHLWKPVDDQALLGAIARALEWTKVPQASRTAQTEASKRNSSAARTSG
jgi:hypothetical protein